MPTKLNTRDAKTIKRLRELADGVVELAGRKRDPYVDVPTRSLSNVKYNKSRRFIEMGRNTNRRHLFNLSQAKTYMQTMLVASGATQLIEQGKTTSIRGLFYLLKHTIEGTKEETFADQDECDPVIEDCEVLLNSLREELHLYAQKKGRHGGRNRPGRLAATRSTARMGSGGYGIPSIVEPEVIEFKRCDGQVHPARRKGHGLAAVQRGQVLAQAQVHLDARRRPAPARRPPAAAPPAQRVEAARLLPAG